MMFEQALYTELKAISELNGSIFPIHAVEKADKPFMTYYKSGVNYVKGLNGPSGTVDGTYTLDILHPSYSELQVIFHKKVKPILISFVGRRIGDVAKGPFIQSLWIENINDLYESELAFHRLNFDINVRYKEEN